MDIDEIRENFHSFNAARRSIIDNAFRDNGIYFGQPPILEYLSRNPDATQKEIADFLSISASSMAVSVKRMEKAGLLMRVSDKNDLRRNNLKLTQKGTELLDFAHETFDRIDEVTFRGFTPEELVMLKSFLSRMKENLACLTQAKTEKEENNA